MDDPDHWSQLPKLYQPNEDDFFDEFRKWAPAYFPETRQGSLYWPGIESG